MKRFYSLRIKIIVIYCFYVIIPLLAINIAIINQYQKSLKESTVNAYDIVSDQIETNLDTYLSSIKRISLYPYYNNQIQELLYHISIDGNADVMTRENNDIMNDFLFNMLIQDKNLQSMEQEFMIIPTHNQSYVNRARKNVFSYARVIKGGKK